MLLLICQNWTEYERGWGCRPDGFTLHPSMKNRDEYVRWHRETHLSKEQTPAEYSSPNKEPYFILVSEELHAEVKANIDKGPGYQGCPPVHWGTGGRLRGPNEVTKDQLMEHVRALELELARLKQG